MPHAYKQQNVVAILELIYVYVMFSIKRFLWLHFLRSGVPTSILPISSLVLKREPFHARSRGSRK